MESLENEIPTIQPLGRVRFTVVYHTSCLNFGNAGLSRESTRRRSGQFGMPIQQLLPHVVRLKDRPRRTRRPAKRHETKKLPEVHGNN